MFKQFSLKGYLIAVPNRRYQLVQKCLKFSTHKSSTCCRLFNIYDNSLLKNNILLQNNYEFITLRHSSSTNNIIRDDLESSSDQEILESSEEDIFDEIDQYESVKIINNELLQCKSAEEVK